VSAIASGVACAAIPSSSTVDAVASLAARMAGKARAAGPSIRRVRVVGVVAGIAVEAPGVVVIPALAERVVDRIVSGELPRFAGAAVVAINFGGGEGREAKRQQDGRACEA
jgi:hypothetical protein